MDSPNKEAAWVFIQWMTSKEIQERATEFGAGPSRHSTYKSETLAEHQPWWVDVYDFMLNDTNPDERIRVPEWAEISDIMGEEGNRVWIGEVDSATAAAKHGAAHDRGNAQERLFHPRSGRPAAAAVARPLLLRSSAVRVELTIRV